MGPFKNSLLLRITTYIISGIVIAANLALLGFTFLGKITFDNWYGYVIFGVIIILALLYFVSLGYVALRSVDGSVEIVTPVFDKLEVVEAHEESDLLKSSHLIN